MAPGIDAAVVLGLAGKASQIFADAGTYLSFALAPMAMEQSRLAALVADPFSDTGQSALAEFSLLVNEIPDGPVWSPQGERLWDIYGDILTGAMLAEATHTPEETAAYEHAYGLLYQTQPDGTVTDAPLVIAYKQYQDAYFAAAYEYNNRKVQAETTSDATLKDRWAADEPVLRARMTEAAQDWDAAGRRPDVDNARRVLQEFGSRSPLTAWAGYRMLFDPAKPGPSFHTSLDGFSYVPTTYFPSDVVNAAWPTFSVARDELPALSAAAPEALRSRLAGESDLSTIDSVSFEYSSVAINRPWFASEMFSSRAWKFYDADRILSDGGMPPSGECTAYVSGLVLARNITVTHAANNPSPSNLGFLPTESMAGRLLITRPPPARISIDRTNARPNMAPARDALRASPPAIVRAPVPLQRITPRASAMTVIPGIRRLTPRSAAAVPAADATSAPPASSYIHVLAFICRLLPKTPNPDPQLRW